MIILLNNNLKSQKFFQNFDEKKKIKRKTLF